MWNKFILFGLFAFIARYESPGKCISILSSHWGAAGSQVIIVPTLNMNFFTCIRVSFTHHQFPH
jgi:hypothetical protein